MKCIHCNQEFESKRKTAKFCSSKCRMAFNYKLALKDDKVSVENSVPPVSVETLSPVIDKELKDYSVQDLYDAIDSYPLDAWICSPEYKELKRRLDVLSVVKLRSLGYWIPNWKGI